MCGGMWCRATDAAAGTVRSAQPGVGAAGADLAGHQQHGRAALPGAALPHAAHRLRPGLQVRAPRLLSHAITTGIVFAN